MKNVKCIISALHVFRQRKVEETQKKLKRYGYTDEDDYNYLTPPEDYNWKPKPNHANGDFHGYTNWAENYRDMVDSFPRCCGKG